MCVAYTFMMNRLSKNRKICNGNWLNVNSYIYFVVSGIYLMVCCGSYIWGYIWWFVMEVFYLDQKKKKILMVLMALTSTGRCLGNPLTILISRTMLVCSDCGFSWSFPKEGLLSCCADPERLWDFGKDLHVLIDYLQDNPFQKNQDLQQQGSSPVWGWHTSPGEESRKKIVSGPPSVKRYIQQGMCRLGYAVPGSSCYTNYHWNLCSSTF